MTLVIEADEAACLAVFAAAVTVVARAAAVNVVTDVDTLDGASSTPLTSL